MRTALLGLLAAPLLVLSPLFVPPALADHAECSFDPEAPPAHATVTGAGFIIGTPGPDVIVGSDGADTILGLGGDDIICGEGGSDRIDGGAGATSWSATAMAALRSAPGETTPSSVVPAQTC